MQATGEIKGKVCCPQGNKVTKLRRRHTRRGQSMVEMALILPLLVLFLSVVIEGGLALNAWIRVTSAARDATRFTLDAGRTTDTVGLVSGKLKGLDATEINIYIVKGTTNASGNIPSGSQFWAVTHAYGGGGADPKVLPATIEARLRDSLPAGSTANQNLKFTIVEVDYNYAPLLASLIARGSKLPMSSYAIVKQY